MLKNMRLDILFDMLVNPSFKMMTIFANIARTTASETTAIARTTAIGETCRHFKTKIDEHIKKDIKSHIFEHLHSTATYFDSYNSLCFKIIDKANSEFDLKVKETLHINWRKPNLNAQRNHLALTLSL